MPTPADESRILRARSAATHDALDRRATDRPGGGGRYLGMVYDGGAMPSAVPRVYLTHPATASADPEAEGSTIAVSVDMGSSVPVVVLGPVVPAVGDMVVAKLVSGYWVAGSGASPPSCTATIRVTVTGCRSQGLAGVTVTATKAGETAVSGTTDGSGVASLVVHAAGSWAVAVTPPARYAAGSASVGAVCGSTAPRTVNLGADATHVCCGACPTPIDRTLYLTDSLGTIPLVFGNSVLAPGTGLWRGCQPITRAGYVRDAYGNCAPATVTGYLWFELKCPTIFSADWGLDMAWPVCPSGFDAAHITDADCSTPVSSVSYGVAAVDVSHANTCTVPTALAFTTTNSVVYPLVDTFTIGE